MRPLLDQLRAAERDALDLTHAIRGPFRVSVALLLAPALRRVCAPLHREHPGLEIRVDATLRFIGLDVEKAIRCSNRRRDWARRSGFRVPAS